MKGFINLLSQVHKRDFGAKSAYDPKQTKAGKPIGRSYHVYRTVPVPA